MKKLPVFCFLFWTCGAAAQNIVCDLEVDVGPEARQETPLGGERRTVDYMPLYRFPVRIVQTFRAPQGLPDTLELAAENVSFWQQSFRKLFFHDIRARAYDRCGRPRDAKFAYRPAEGRISVAVPDSAAAVELSYDFQPDFVFRNASDSWVCVQPYFPGWQSWHFTAEGMTLGDAAVSLPDGVYCYGNLEAPAGSSPFFCLLNGRFYERYEGTAEGTSVALLVHKGTKTDTVPSAAGPCTVLSPGGRDTEAIARSQLGRLLEAAAAVRELCGNRDTVSITVADAKLYFTDNRGNRYPWGRGLEYAPDRWLLLVDDSMWKSHSVVHEALHPLLKHAPPRSDSAWYFFTESLTEYLAVRFGYESRPERDSVFAAHRAHYESVKQSPELSVFRLTDNSVALDGSGAGTSWVVYEKAPCAINDLAESMGEEAFLDALRMFFRTAASDGTINMEALRRCITSGGKAGEEDWNRFVKAL